MNLYHIQDDDRPMHVVAEDWNAALEAWKDQIRLENEGEVHDGPDGISLVAKTSDPEKFPEILVPREDLLLRIIERHAGEVEGLTDWNAFHERQSDRENWS